MWIRRWSPSTRRRYELIFVSSRGGPFRLRHLHCRGKRKLLAANTLLLESCRSELRETDPSSEIPNRNAYCVSARCIETDHERTNQQVFTERLHREAQGRSKS